MRKPVRKPIRRPRAPAEPSNQSTAAGRPAPESAAATAPRAPSFYSPEAESAPVHQLRESASAELQDSRQEGSADRLPRPPSEEHVAAVRSGAVQHVEHSSVDYDLARAAQDHDADYAGDYDGRRDADDVTDEDAAPGYRPGENLESDIARIRGLRRPLGSFTQKLALNPRPGYYTHWFNDEGGRIGDALDNGWAHRLDKEGKNIRRAVGRGRDAGVLYAFAMCIPEVFWQEDQAAKHKDAASKMESLKANPFPSQAGQAKQSDHGKFYSPREEPLSVSKV